MHDFIAQGEHVVEHITGTENPEDISGALEWFHGALPREVEDWEVRQAVVQAEKRIAGLRRDAAERGALLIATPYELRMIVNRFRRFSRNGSAPDCWSPLDDTDRANCPALPVLPAPRSSITAEEPPVTTTFSPDRATHPDHRRLIEIVGDTTTLLEILPRHVLPRARTAFRAGLVHRRRRDATGSPYLTDGDSEAAYTVRTLEAIEVFGTDLADLLDQADEAVKRRVEMTASPLFRCVIGPLKPSHCRVEPACISWDNSLVVRIARETYDRRDGSDGRLDPVRLAILANALVEAGCGNAALLDHLRSGGRHESACWVIDLLRHARGL